MEMTEVPGGTHMQTVFVNGAGYELASLWERWSAQLLDGFFYVLLFFIAGLPFFVLAGGLGMFVGSAVAGLYLLFQDGMAGGRSWGKKIAGTRVIDAETGAPCSIGQSLVRNLLLAVLNIFDWIFIFGDTRQRIGDMVAKTYVVRV